MKLYRVFPYRLHAAGDEPGGAFHIPIQGRGRIDKPSDYRVFYAADAAAGAIAEVFNVGDYRLKWSEPMLRARGGATLSMATYELDDGAAICDLDDAMRLCELELRPSTVVTRDYSVTRAWAQRIHDLQRFAGVRWWSYHDARWGSLGIWADRALRRADIQCIHIEALTLDHPAVAEAAAMLSIEVART